VLVTPADVTENQPMLDLLWRTIFRWRARVRRLTGDATYGTSGCSPSRAETEETGAGRGPAGSGTDPFGERQAPPGQPSSEIHTAPRTFFNGLTPSTTLGA
jgi:hypothetical protein